jgi:hypothetical protein
MTGCFDDGVAGTRAAGARLLERCCRLRKRVTLVAKESEAVMGQAELLRSTAAVGAVMALAAALASPAAAATKKQQPIYVPAVERTASGTVIQPTTTIIPGPNGQRTVIVIPRKRSYLDTGTEVSVGDRSYRDYMLSPGGEPGRPNWWYGPDVQGKGSYPFDAFNIPGFNPNTPF